LTVSSPLDQRPIVVALAGPNGARKTTFYYAHLEPAGLRFVNADLLARELNIDPYEAAALAASIREELIRQRASFVFETVFFDPVGDKLSFLTDELLQATRCSSVSLVLPVPKSRGARGDARQPGRPRRALRKIGQPLSADPGKPSRGASKASACVGFR
jgi:hypothetical protein